MSQSPSGSKNIRMHHSFPMAMIVGDLKCLMAESPAHNLYSHMEAEEYHWFILSNVSSWEDRDKGIIILYPEIFFFLFTFFFSFYFLKSPIQGNFQSWLCSVLTLSPSQAIFALPVLNDPMDVLMMSSFISSENWGPLSS